MNKKISAGEAVPEGVSDIGQELLDAVSAAVPLVKHNLISIVAAAEVLASGWEYIYHDQPDTKKFFESFLSTLNALIRECMQGNIQAYSSVSGLPLEIHHSSSQNDGPLYDHTCLLKLDDFDAWITKNRMSHSLSHLTVHDVPLTDLVESRKPALRRSVRVAWLIVLHANIENIDAAYGGKAKVLEAIKWLKANGGERIKNKGYAFELFWIDDNDTEQLVKKKTVSTALSVARKLA